MAARGRSWGGGSGGVALARSEYPRRTIVNEQVVFAWNGGSFSDPAYPLDYLVPIADIAGAGVVDHIKLIAKANDAARATQLVIFVDGEILPSVNFQLSHFGLDYQPTFFPAGLTGFTSSGRMYMRAMIGASGIGACHFKFNYEIPFSSRFQAFLYLRQPTQTWWTEVSYLEGKILPYRLKSKSSNSVGPTYSRGGGAGTTGYLAAASSFPSPNNSATPVALPAFSTLTPTTLQDGSVSLVDVPAGKAGTIAMSSFIFCNPSAAAMNYQEVNVSLFTAAQKAAGITRDSIAPFMATGWEDYIGSAFYIEEGVGNWGDFYVTDYNTTNNSVGGPGNANANNIRVVLDVLAKYKGGIHFANGAYMTFVQKPDGGNLTSSAEAGASPRNKVGSGTNAAGLTGPSVNVNMAFCTLWYEFG